MSISQNMHFQISILLWLTLWISQSSARCLLVCIGVRVIFLLGHILPLQLSQSHCRCQRGSWNGGIPEQLCSGHRAADHRRKLIPLHHSNRRRMCNTTLHTNTQTKAMRLKKKKSPSDTQRWDENAARQPGVLDKDEDLRSWFLPGWIHAETHRVFL